MDDKPCDPPYPLAVLLPSSRGLRSFRSPSPIYHDIRLVTECLLSTGTVNLQTGGCSWLLTSNLYRLPFVSTVDQGSQLGAEIVYSCLARPIVAIFTCTPFEIHTSLADLGLAFCRVVTDLTPNFTFPPISDSHLPYGKSC